jgi:hypothetical protein
VKNGFLEPITCLNSHLLEIKSKHHVYKFLVNTQEELDDVCLNYVKNNLQNFFEIDVPKKISQQSIDLCDNSYYKEQMIKHNDNCEDSVKKAEKHNKVINQIKSKAIKGLSKGMFALISKIYTYDNFELIEFDTL